MFVQQQLEAIKIAQQALQTLATIWPATAGDYRAPPTPLENGTYYDYVVIGGGSSGCAVAARLSEDPCVKVLVLEAGGFPPMESYQLDGVPFMQNGQADWKHHSQKDEKWYQCLKDKRQTVNHGYGLGGGSLINLMLYMQGHRNDYDIWANLTGDPTWGPDYVQPYFKKGQRFPDFKNKKSRFADFYGTDGPVGITELSGDITTKYLNIFEEMGYPDVKDIFANPSLGFNPQKVSAADGRRQSSAYAYVASAFDRCNLHILTNSYVTRIILDKKNVAKGVEYQDKNNKTYTVYVNNEVILSAGPIMSPHILHLSGIGPKKHLESFGIPCKIDLPVGEQLYNHYGPIMAIKGAKCSPKFKKPPIDSSKFPLSSMITGFMALNKSQSYPDYVAATVPVDAENLAVIFCSIIFGLDTETCQAYYDETYGHEVLFVALFHGNNENRGSIRLKSTDPRAPPDIYMAAYPDEKAFELMLHWIADFLKILETSYYKEVGGELVILPQCKKFVGDFWELIRCNFMCSSASYYHYGGTNAMGLVTNSDMSVKKAKALRCVDSSIMPFVPSATTNAPSFMIGERGADIIKKANRNRLLSRKKDCSCNVDTLQSVCGA